MTRRNRGRRLERVTHPGGGGTPVPPAGMSLWLDATDGAAPSVWTDKSAGNHNATQATGANQPTVVTGINGLPCVSFNGTSQFYTLPNFLTTLTACDVFIIMRSLLAPGSFSGFATLGSSGTGDNVPSFDNNAYTDVGATVRRMVVPTVPVRTAQCLEIISTSSEWTAVQNDIQAFTTATNTVGWSTAPWIGQSASHDFWNGLFGEFLIYDHKLSTADRAQARTYLKTKWGT